MTQKEAIESLQNELGAGDTIHCILRHVSRSGMSRIIDCYHVRDNDMIWIGRKVAAAVGMRYDDRRQGVRVGGCGMDMGFHLVYELSYVLFRDGFSCIGERCPSNDHSNGDRDYTPHLHKDGGYSLRHSWI